MAERDNRDELTWVVFELTAAGERLASEGQIESYLRDTLGCGSDHPVFVPYMFFSYGTRSSVFNVMEGYSFVASGLDERLYVAATHESPYLRSVLSSGSGSRAVLLTVPDSDIQDLRDQLSQMIAVEIEEGMQVEVVRGSYRGLEGCVVALTDEMAHVLIELRTLRTIRTIPRFALLPREEEDV